MTQVTNSSGFGLSNFSSEALETQLAAIALRFNRQYRGDTFEVPPEVEAMPIFQEWIGGGLTAKISSPFWEICKPKKGQKCLDIGCGVSFLIYPWRDWDAVFYGQEISREAQEALNARGPQLNSKLFNGVKLAPAHQLEYEKVEFDLAIATGWSCYFSLEYWEQVMRSVKSVLKPGGQFVFDLLNPEIELAENWAILETYLGADVTLESLSEWEKIMTRVGAKVVKRKAGDIFNLYSVKFP
ncbi:class I SAM-dependent methyltransferase [Roseofilum casamattae]|uniref:Methyltransferase domain-containing protein n=1 Tax=Roseofilum casamattae BLCC-M143 TaxID=3022442 RepID=A0ABT7BWP8_9CYAN|nr:methyltransferase domain-containing protein [Roseofilum casamattae]MDJ1183500.1 methyltransferase domain-containing protein [Roseofilum casamattae BLCC-M143]